MKVSTLEIEDVLLIRLDVHEDHRGFFMELYKESLYRKLGIDYSFVQDNLSFSKKGVLRGLHYQIPPKEQGKLVACLKGRIQDVVVDLRKSSSTYGKWVSVILSSDEPYVLWIPPGFAHGFYALEDSIVMYKVTKEYSREHEGGIAWNDPKLNIRWLLEGEPILSDKDKNLPYFDEAYKFV